MTGYRLTLNRLKHFVSLDYKKEEESVEQHNSFNSNLDDALEKP